MAHLHQQGIQDPREGPSLARRTMQDLLWSGVARQAHEVQRDQDQEDGKAEVIVEPKTASPQSFSQAKTAFVRIACTSCPPREGLGCLVDEGGPYGLPA